jgi:glycosyltransferase involved in cell wall biosynthesis
VHCAPNTAVGMALATRIPTVYFAHDYSATCPAGTRFLVRSGQVCTRPMGAACFVAAWVDRCAPRRPARLLAHVTHAAGTRDWLEHVKHVVVDSHFVRADIARVGIPDGRISVLPTPVRLPAVADDAEQEDPRTVLFAGRVARTKGLHELLRAMEHVSSDWRLDVVGDGPDLQLCREIVSRRGLTDRVTFYGWLSRDELMEAYARAALIAVPSLWPEPFGMVGPEAMAHGKPTVAFGVGGIPDWLEDGVTGFVAQPGDALQMARSISTLLGDVSLRRALGARARTIAVRKYGMEAHLAGLLPIFRALERQVAHA